VNDPLTPLLGVWGQLGIVGSVVIALAWIAYHLWQKLHATSAAHLAEVKSCATVMQDVAVKKIESELKMANALEGLETVVRTALDTMRRNP